MIIPPESLNPGHNSLNAMGQWGVPIEPGRYFAGSLDEVRLYSRALDVADVATLAGVTPPNRPPAVSCPPASALGCAGPQGLSVVVQTLMTDPDTGTLTVTLKEDGTARDTQTVASPAQNQAVNFASVTFLPGTHTLTIEVSDGSKTASCQTTLEIVQDTQPPTITAPAAVTVNTDAGKCEATSVVLGTSTTADNCGVATVANNAPTVFPKGVTTVTWTVTDNAGNTASATQTVTVTDAENPTTTAPADVTVSTDAGKSYASGVALGTANTTDNCGVAGTVNDAPAQFPQGNTTVTWTVTDTSGNTATATQVVTVKDTEPPTIIPPADVVVNTDPGANQSGTILTPPVTSDNSGIASVTSDAPAVFPFGSTLVTWTVTDTSGNASTITQTVTVRDAEKPSIVPRQLPTPVSVTPGLCSASGVNLGTPTVSDNCGIKRVVNDAPAVFPKGITIVTWTVTDTSDNTATATQTVTVVDHEDPTITAPAAVVVNADAGKNYASSVTLGSPETTDNCGVASVANNAPETFPQGDTTVTWTVTDTSGNKATATQTVTVADCEKPTITAPEDVLTVSDAGSCNATSVALGNPATADNCDVLSTVNDHQAATFPLGETLVTWTVTDASGNTATAVQKVTVLPSVSVTFLSPLAGQPVANKIRHGQVVPHKVTLASCSGASPPAGVTVKLKVQGIDSADNSVFQEVPEDANGVGSDGTVTSDGIMVLNDGNYQFNLDTSNFGDPNTLASPTKYYRSTVTVVDNATLMVLGTVAVNLETR